MGAIIFEGNFPGVIILGGNCVGGNCLVGNYPGHNHPGGNYPGDNYPGGGGSNFPRGQLS